MSQHRRPIFWWTSRVRSTSKTWTTWPVYHYYTKDGFAYVQGLVGKRRGVRFSVVANEITPYPPPRAKIAVGAKRYLAEYEAQQYAKRHGGHVLVGNFHHKQSKKTANDPETRRKIRRLEERLKEALAEGDSRAIRDACQELISLHSDLGEAAKVVKYRRVLKLVSRSLRRQQHRYRSQTRLQPLRGRRPKRLEIVEMPVMPARVLWSKDDLKLVETIEGEFALTQYKTYGIVLVRRFKHQEEAIDYLVKRFGPLFFKSNDPERHRRAKRSRR